MAEDELRRLGLWLVALAVPGGDEHGVSGECTPG